ncbi:MAG TPA: TIGR02265 family protein [Myxococcaceae bacterium]|nr:TIGR02265 family protein [Myxococcaceae bacterium]
MDMNSSQDNVMAHEARTDLQQRLLLATPQHTTRGFLFSALLRVVRELGGDETVVQHCLAASGEKSFVDFFNYPTRSLLLLLSDAAQQLSGKLGGYEEVLRQMGFRGGCSFMETPVGRAAMQHAGGNPQRFMVALESLYGVLTTYGKPALSFPGPNQGVLAIGVTFMPLSYHVGGAQAVAQKLGVKNVDIRARKTGGLSIELVVSW